MDEATRERAAGVLLGQACGDALGVPYEFAAPPVGPAAMVGGGLGPYAPGEWSDDTQMALVVARVAASGADLRGDAALDEVAEGFLAWARAGASDIGVQTWAVLGDAERADPALPAGRRVAEAAAALHARTGRTAGNGALMRTAVVGLVDLGSRATTAEAAAAVAALTHPDPLAAESCVLWCEAVRTAVTSGAADVADGLDLLPAGRRDAWAAWIAEAATRPPAAFAPNGFTVTALQAAWSAVVASRSSATPFEDGLQAAVLAGDDTDTVAAIAGGLLGALHGASAVPPRWRADVHGWPGLRADDLVELAVETATARP
ncbi:hypothetical protein GCM10028777_21480 [Angustibacter speluncae]